MCGLVAWFGTRNDDIPERGLQSALERMRRRGPDDEGVWREQATYLGHRRLAILDLDHRAAQPMQSACGRYVIVLNGEIYNYLSLRRDLEHEGAAFRTTSDTEVLLAMFAARGEAMLTQLHGMFAFVIWDRVARRAFLARDPYGIKPLYLAQTSAGLLVGSQVKALLRTGLLTREPDVLGQSTFWMLGSVAEPRTWFRDIQALPAGHYAWVDEGRLQPLQCWHDIGEEWRNAHPVEERADLCERVRRAVEESVARHQVSDVPVGVFLSGGVDSGVLAGLIGDIGAHSVQGVTLSYEEFESSKEDELPRARQLASHYGLKHAVRRVTRAEFLSDFPRIVEAMDQPTIDGINTWYASKAAAELGLKVVISGVGGDELFQGYSSFRQLPRIVAARRALGWFPGAAAALRAAGRIQAGRSANLRWRHVADWSRSIEGAWWLRRSTCAPEELANVMGLELAREALRDFDVVERVHAMTGRLAENPALALGQIESMTYLRNQLLRDSDWASMDHSIELRTPLVDAHLLSQLGPLLYTFSRGKGKRLLAAAPRRGLPDAISSHPKTGFGIPVLQWLAQGTTAGAGRVAMSRHIADRCFAS